jgi:hypothetical protein
MCIDTATLFVEEFDQYLRNDEGSSRVGCQETSQEAYFEI